MKKEVITVETILQVLIQCILKDEKMVEYVINELQKEKKK